MVPESAISHESKSGRERRARAQDSTVGPSHRTVLGLDCQPASQSDRCPTRVELKAALMSDDEQLQDAVFAHVECCGSCQNVVDRLSAPLTEIVKATSQSSDNRAQDEDPLQQLLQSLKHAGLPETQTSPSRQLHSILRDDTLDSPVSFPGPPSADAPLGTLGPYQIQAHIGSGASGHLFRAMDGRLGRIVAIKVLRHDHAALESLRLRFEREARAIARLQDDSIVAIHEVVTDGSFPPYLVMEYVDGQSLHERKAQQNVFAANAAASLLIGVLNGLNAAHAAGVIHRDIKPSNVLIKSRGDSIKLVDFGLARINEQQPIDLTTDCAIAGTPAYMSPEQINAPSAVDARSDVYSAGVVLYELLTGDVPFRGVTRMVLQQALNEDPLPPRQLNDNIPRDLETICLKAMSREPSRRYQTAADFQSDLKRWQCGEPIMARPLGRVGRAIRWMKRNRQFASFLIVLAGLVVAIISSSMTYTVSLAKTNDRLSASNSALVQRTEQLHASQRSAVANARLASRQANLAFGLINELVFDVQTQLGTGEQHRDLRESLLNRAVRGLAKLADTLESAGDVDVTLVAALNRMGDCHRQAGDLLNAEKCYRRAMQLLESRPQANNTTAVKRAKIWTAINIAGVVDENNIAESNRLYDLAAKLGTAICSDSQQPQPVRDDVRRNLVTSIRNQADLARRIGQDKQARMLAEQAAVHAAKLQQNQAVDPIEVKSAKNQSTPTRITI